MKLKNRIRVLRAEKEISQKELAEVIGVSRQTVNSIEKGKFNPSVITALKLAEYFAVNVETVFQILEDDSNE
ncbi:MAG TPA: helix-turn-helix transcriptional regulator [Candidatus Sabulitectum sp.]|nr:helix-turn-helix transcriptional regulator [Candidatus Sabulitectum sp.]HPJ27988.1 helix-turn-helix transcriptional regulator [Candidatus Sabulitectum sp.]HPR21791.1 helix-turn-helix transcriptional regulator [Candidatus Sabulitectum sp.]HRW78200.1 helix-turn-helix transcriptional regulator [Candidatus Sabulitectum sp.]